MQDSPWPSGVTCVSVVVPVFNEDANLRELHDELVGVLGALPSRFEVVYVDDGSTDESFARLERLASEDDRVRVCQFRRNYGQTAAIAAGIDMAAGDLVILMDADLQNDPNDIPAMLAKLSEGYDVVSGWRRERKDPWLTRRLPSQLANGLISRITGVRLHDYGCTLKVYRRDIVKGFRLYGEMHRFLPAYASQMGARIAEVAVNHRPRLRGSSKYGLERTLKVILDLVVVKFLGSYSNRPIHLFGGVGASLVLSSFMLLAFLVWRKLGPGDSLIESPLLLMVVMLFILGFQTIFMGLLAEILNRTYHESQDKPTYTVRRVLPPDAGE